MLTLGEFIAVISVCIACFSLGYKLGRDNSIHRRMLRMNRNSRPGLAKLGRLFLNS